MIIKVNDLWTVTNLLTNLHATHDSKLISYKKIKYTELTAIINYRKANLKFFLLSWYDPIIGRNSPCFIDNREKYIWKLLTVSK